MQTLLPPIEERPELSAMLNQIRSIDANGWCTITDGSLDDLTTEEASELLRNILNNLSQNF